MLFCFDVESNGLLGDAFAFGAVILDPGFQVIDTKIAVAPFPDKPDPWVLENIIETNVLPKPSVETLPQ